MAKKKHGKVYEVETPGRKERYSHVWLILMFFLVFFYLEMILRYSTIRGMLVPQGGYIAIFSAFYAVAVYLITTISPWRKLNRILHNLVILIFCVLFCVNYFVYLQFKIFYDLNTVLAGSGDVITSFGERIIQLTCNVNGVGHILAFMAPYLFWLWKGKRIDSGRPIAKQLFLKCLLAGGLLWNSALSLVFANRIYSMFYKEQYNFQMAISNFGFLSGIRLDFENSILKPIDHAGFDQYPISYEETSDTEEEQETPNAYEEAVVYPKNVMEIDFEALSENATSLQKDLDTYVQAQKPSSQNAYTGLFRGKNLIFITAEAFSAEVIDQERTPTLYRLANRGIQFTDYYQPASSGTTGGEFENIFGMLPMLGGSSLKITANYNNYMTIGAQLDRLGYQGWAFHNNDYMFYDRHLTHNNLGYSNGFMGYGNGMEAYVTSQWPQSDLEMIEGTMDLYMSSEEPFNVYYMSVSGHNGYKQSENAMTRKHWEEYKDLDASDEVKGYLAANQDLEDAMYALVKRLESEGKLDDTVIVIAADHFPYGLDYNASLGDMPYLSELYGYSVTNYLERDHNRLIIWSGALETMDPIVVEEPTSSLDILPTLSNLFGTEWDSRLFVGRDVFSDTEALVFDINYDWKTSKGTYLSWTGQFIPKEGVTVPDGYVERITNLVRNKIIYCEGVVNNDYFGHLFGTKEENDN